MKSHPLDAVLAEARECFREGRLDEAESRIRAATEAFSAIEQQLLAAAPDASSIKDETKRLRLAKDVLPLLRIDTLMPQLADGQGLPEPFAGFFSQRAELHLSPALIGEFCTELDRHTAMAKKSAADLEELGQSIAADEARAALLARFVLLFRMQSLAEADQPSVFDQSLIEIAASLKEFGPLAVPAEVRNEVWLDCERAFGELLDALDDAVRSKGSLPTFNTANTASPQPS